MTATPTLELRTFDAVEPVRNDPVDEYTERPAAALKEIGVRSEWRKTGTARRIHDALLATRAEPFVSLSHSVPISNLSFFFLFFFGSLFSFLVASTR